MPARVKLKEFPTRLGRSVRYSDDFAGSAADLSGRSLESGQALWEKTLGNGTFSVHDGVQVQATRESPNPGRTFYTLPWSQPDFSDLEVTITPPGCSRGERHACRCGLVFWEDNENYLSFTAWLDDAYNGASLSIFPKRHGFEELYDAIWTNVWKKIFWGVAFRLRVTFDGDRFLVLLDDEPVLQRSLSDLYPDDPPFRIRRVGLAVNWEWGNDTGSRFESFKVRY